MIDTLLLALESHAWPLVVGLVLVAFVRFATLPAAQVQWLRIPAAWRPVVPVALGLVSSIGDALVSGRAWLPAILYGLGASSFAFLLALPSPVVPGATVVVEGDTVRRDTDRSPPPEHG